MADFPTGISTWTNKTDGVDYPEADDVNQPNNEVIAIQNYLVEAATEVTVSSGVLTVTKSRHTVQPESGTSDDIDTITGIPDNGELILTVSDLGTDTIVFKHGTGNLSLPGAADITLTTGGVRLYRKGSTVYALGDGVGSVTATSTTTFTNKRITKRVTTITSHATPTVNTDNCDAVTITAQAEAITSMTTNLSGTPTNFQPLLFRIKDDGTARAITWGASFEAKGVALPTTTVINKVLTVGFIYDTVTSKWGCVASAQEA